MSNQIMASPSVTSDEHGATIDYGHGVVEHTRETQKEAEDRIKKEVEDRGEKPSNSQ
ncbi:hypothetical protein ACFODO_06645 [Acinetobacter sichuanensis]|uniref:Uncharacterized protein n=1 Tax=Acinetobacter sichuanensis TaxID=2136183 RepID=A0ABV7BBZ6_9GAMM|nr:hypothetical protein [Acinetobacter sichuanensis]